MPKRQPNPKLLLDSKTHSRHSAGLLAPAVSDCRALGLSNTAASHANQLSIFPTATLSFVILSLEKLPQVLRPGFMNKTSMKTAADKLRTMHIIDAAIGGSLCLIAAIVASAIANGHPWKSFVPLIFSVVLLLNARLFGARAGLLGTVLAALVFAGFLFSPVGSIQVANESARANLGWMLLIGIGFSFLFAPPTSGCRR